jgi:GDP-4-dehydro-6-deoxy-D-mannose reductase
LFVRVLITGVGGFVGKHLAKLLLGSQPEAELHGTVLHLSGTLAAGVTHHALDLRDATATRQLLHEIRPDVIYHVAAIAAVGRSFSTAWETIENNALAQFNVLESCLKLDTRPRVLIVSSGEIYGPARPDHLPANEDAPLRPSSPYSVSKVTQDMLGLQYFIAHELPVVRVRPFNHMGPGQGEGFVAPDFAMQIARIEAGLQEPRMYVGNLDALRDFLDVRDVVRAYHLLMTHGVPGEVYNVASGVTHSIRDVLNTLVSYSKVPVEVCNDPNRMRPASVPVLWGDASRLKHITGWQPTIPFEQTLLDVLNDCRQRVNTAQ